MKYAAVAIGIVALATSAAAQQAALSPEAAFGAREHVASAALSPDGTRMSYIAPTTGAGNALYTVALTGDATPRRVVASSGDPERLTQCSWVSNDRLVCTVFVLRQAAGDLEAASRLLAINADGSDVKIITRALGENARYFNYFGGGVLDWLPNESDHVLLGSQFVPTGRAGTLVERREEGYGVERVNTRTLSRERIVKPILDASEYITDGIGHVRIVGFARRSDEGYSTGRVDYRYRDAVGGDWKPLSTVDTATDTGFNPYAVDPDRNIVYGVDKRDGRLAMFSQPLDGTATRTLVFGRDDVDVDGLIRLGRRGRVVGVTYATEKRTAKYFDPALEKLRTSLSRAIPNAQLVNFEGASLDENKLLIWAGSDIDPGRYFLFDRTSKALSPLLSSRPELAGMTLAPVKPITYRAADGTMIPGYLTLPPGSNGKGLPAIVMPHGGPGARDEWGFDWQAQYFAARGYAVLQPNFRGSTGYGDAWYKTNGFQSWRTAIGDVVDAGRWLVSEGIAAPTKLGIVGWSYGGYAALQSGVVAPDLFKAIVATAPVTDLALLREQYYGTAAQRTMRDFIGTGPHIAAGSPAQNAARITAPVLMFHGTLDRNVEYRESVLMRDRLAAAGKRGELVTYPKLDHYLEDATARADMLRRSDAFLKAAFAN